MEQQQRAEQQTFARTMAGMDAQLAGAASARSAAPDPLALAGAHPVAAGAMGAAMGAADMAAAAGAGAGAEPGSFLSRQKEVALPEGAHAPGTR
jgi:hypothetical protein